MEILSEWILPDGQLSGEGFLLFLDLQLRGLQTQRLPGLHFFDPIFT